MLGLHHRDIVVENVSRDIISSHPTALAHFEIKKIDLQGPSIEHIRLILRHWPGTSKPGYPALMERRQGRCGTSSSGGATHYGKGLLKR
jgi:hypothetical protein